MSDLIDRIVAEESTIKQINHICQCKVCGEKSFENIYLAEHCHHGTYCKKCIPNCKVCFSQRHPIPFLSQLLKKSKLKCSFANNGCKAIVPFDYIATHEASCTMNKKKWSMVMAVPDLKYTAMENEQIKSKRDLVSKIPYGNFPNSEYDVCSSENFEMPGNNEYLEIHDLEKRIEAIEIMEPVSEFKLSFIRQEIFRKLDESAIATEESLKQFCESKEIIRIYSRSGFFME